MKNLLVVLFSGTLLLSCNSKSDSDQPEKLNSYNKEGLSFDLPKYWEVAEDSQITGGRYVEVENKEPFGSGLVVMSIFDEAQDNAAVVEMMSNKYRSIFAEQNLQYETLHQPKDVTVGTVNAKEGNGQVQALGEKEQIRVVVFDLPNGKTACVALTGNSDDFKENVKESEEIIKSMQLN